MTIQQGFENLAFWNNLRIFESYTTVLNKTSQKRIEMKILYLLFLFSFSINIPAQYSELCNISKSEKIDSQKVDVDDLLCIAKNADTPFTIFYTLASWCEPCRLHFPDAIDLEKTGKVNLFVILVESESDKRVVNAINFIKSYSKNVKYGVLKDEVYGTKTGKRNNKFVKQITPARFELIEDYGKFIVIDKSGTILYVSNWKDYDKDWKNAKKMIENKIIPLLH